MAKHPKPAQEAPLTCGQKGAATRRANKAQRADKMRPWGAAAAPAKLRRTELIGLMPDGRMVLWDTGDVRPVRQFNLIQGWRVNAHYVIDWKGHAITVHCEGEVGGAVKILFMSGGHTIFLPYAEIEAMVIGVVVPDPAEEASIVARLQELSRLLRESRDQPHRQRGRIG